MRRNLFRFIKPVPITVSLSLLAAVLFFIGIPFFDLMEMKSFDLRFVSRGVVEPEPEVVLAVIDEKSLETEGRWPWPRSKMADLVDNLSRDGAKVVSFDVGFLEPDENINLRFLDHVERLTASLNFMPPPLREFIGKSRKSADNDLKLSQSMKNSHAGIVLGYFFHMNQENLDFHIDPKEIDRLVSLIGNSRYPLVSFVQEDAGLENFLTAYAPESNLEIISGAASSAGYFNMFPGRDGVVRYLPLVIRCGGEHFMPLSLRSVWEYLDRPQLVLRVAPYGLEGIRMGDRFIPTDENGRFLINYLGPGKTFPHYSIGDILRGNIPEGTFKGKIVIVGATAVGIYDLRNTPFDPIYPGLEIHATVIDNILKGNFLRKPAWTTIYDLFAVMVLGLFSGIAVSRTGPFKGLVFAVLIYIAHIYASRWFFVRMGLWVNMIYPLLAVTLVYIALTMYHYFVEEKNKRFLHTTFRSYLSPELIEQMVKKEAVPELGGEARIVTAFFTDIQGFSTFSEILTAHQLVELLNEYLTAMTDILIREGGTLDKYEGDAIVAFLGAPLYLPDHALRACRVAVNMQKALSELRKKWAEEKDLAGAETRNTKGLPPEIWRPGDKWPRVVHGMRMRIGVNTGEIVVGNMGSSLRMNYTMMGDAVNLAARLEAGAKQYGIYNAVSEHTLNTEYVENGKTMKVLSAVEARFIDRITVVGKNEPVKLYELCAMKGGLTEKEKELFRLFNKAMDHYLEMDWDEAIRLFSQSSEVERTPQGKTTPSEVFLRRCRDYKKSPPVRAGKKWDGVYRMTRK